LINLGHFRPKKLEQLILHHFNSWRSFTLCIAS